MRLSALKQENDREEIERHRTTSFDQLFGISIQLKSKETTMKAYLKIKLKSLAAESTMIHREERRHNIGHRGRVRIRRQLAKATDLTEAKRARLERRMQKPSDKAMTAFWGLRHHRIWDVRNESRSSHLAYGFLRGLPYNRIEGNTKTVPDWSRVETLVRKYGEDDVRDRMQRFSEWRSIAEG